MKYDFSMVLIILLFALFEVSEAQVKNIAKLKNTYNEINRLLEKENGKMWGVKLYGPLMFIDPATKNFVTNEQDIKKSFTEKDGLFFGKLSDNAIVANTALDINGKQWTMVMLPLPEKENIKRSLIIHEFFHSIQNQLGHARGGGMNNHLDKKSARVLLRLEWNALLKAITDDKSKTIYHLENALLFRFTRRLEYSNNIASENSLEMLEGLAEYTGLTLGFDDENSKIENLANKVKNVLVSYPSFVSSFAYVSGGLYGYLLDNSGKEWRKDLNKNSDFGELIWEKYSLSLPAPSQDLVEKRKSEYGFTEIETYESERDEANKKIAAAFKKKFLEDPTIYLPGGFNIQYNPSEITPLEGVGNIYLTIKIVAKWGVLDVVKTGAVIADKWDYALVSAPFTTEGNTLKGEGWTLVLNDGWKAVPRENSNSFKLEKQNNPAK